MLELSNVSKSFGAVQALTEASLEMHPGELRAFLGANGSGKSTMVKILSGLVQRDTGTLTIDGTPVNITNPVEARDNNIIAAYQDLSLIPRLSIAENLALGHEPQRRFGLVDKHARTEQAAEVIEQVGIEASPETLVEHLDPSNQALVEMAKALTWNPKYLLIDEITASLYKRQVERLFSLLHQLADRGVSILFVSHRLDEVFSLCSTATILRSGSSIADLDLRDVDEEDLVYYMTGEKVHTVTADAPTALHSSTAEPVLEAEHITVDAHVTDVSVRLYPGEIVGVAGLQGQGQSEFLRALYGYVPMSAGTVRLKGKSVRLTSPADAIREGIGFLPGDREREGAFPIRPLTENLFAARDGIRSPFAVDTAKKNADEAKKIINRLNVVAAGPFALAKSLSGGNQQKIIVGRWLNMNLKVLILDDPTKGVDVSSRREIHKLLRHMAEEGVALLYSSSDNEELLDVCDRIIVFFDGRITASIPRTHMTPEALASATLGVFSEGVGTP